MTSPGPATTGRGSDPRTLLAWVCWVVLYAVALEAGRQTISRETGLALVWPAAGIGFAWTLWAWRRSGLAGATTAAVVGGLVTAVGPVLGGVDAPLVVGFSLAQSVMAGVAAAVFLAHDPHAALRSVRSLWVLLLAALAGSTAGALVGPSSLVLLEGSPISTYPQWVVRNTVSLFVVVACVLAARHAPRGISSPAARWETVAAALVSVAAYGVLFGPWTRLPLSFAVLALSVWVGLRVGTRAAAALAAGGGTVVVVATVTGTGPFAAIGGGTGILLSQAFVAMVALVTLSLALQRDVQEELSADLGASERRLRSAFEAAPVGMLLAPLVEGAPGSPVRVNVALATFLGRSVDDLATAHLGDLVDERDRELLTFLLEQLCDGEVPERTELRFRHRANGTAWGAVSLSALPGQSGRGHTLMFLVEDITARKEAEAALSRQALHDHLTGLPNRTLLVDRLERATRAADTGRAGVVYLDIDGFKALNEQLGHAGGDDLLTRFGSRIAGCVGTIDTVARLGGDEFAVLCEDLGGQSELEGIADRVRATILEPFHVAGAALAVTASLGVALAERDEHPESVLRRAERLMSRAKNGGRTDAGRVSPEQARAARTLRLLPELERALAQDEFCMFGQPIVDVATGRTVAVETLLRWRHPQRGLLAPGEFLDVLENSSLMTEAGSRVLGLSLRMARDWWDVLGPEAPLVHVNVSGAQLQDGHLSEALRTAQAASGVPMTQVVLELTETHAPLISDSLLSDVGNLRRDGVRIALDDLGTGYSSLQRITELPTDILKIDQRFVAGLGSDPRCSAIVRGVLSMSQALGLSVIAEGVETPEQHRLLRQHQCDTAQGYLYARPLPADELRDLLAAQRSLVPR